MKDDEIEDIPNSYDFSQGVRGKHSERLRKYGYRTTVHHSDGSKTVTHHPPTEDDDMLPHYDFSQPARPNKYAEHLRKRGYTTVVHHDDGSETVTYHPPTESYLSLEPDIAKLFPTSEAVNKALRALIELTQHLPQMQEAAPSQAG